MRWGELPRDSRTGRAMPIESRDRACSAQAANMSQRLLTQLQPFNDHRFDDCMAFLAAKHGRPLSVYEMMKLHAMIDVYHTLDRGKPVIGGSLWPFTNGPISRVAKSRVGQWR